MTAVETIARLLRENNPESPEEAAALVCENYTLLPKALDHGSGRQSQPDPEIGQIWRNRESKRLVEITDFGRGGFGEKSVIWHIADDSRGPKQGRVFIRYWKSRFDFVTYSKEDAL